MRYLILFFCLGALEFVWANHAGKIRKYRSVVVRRAPMAAECTKMIDAVQKMVDDENAYPKLRRRFSTE